MSTTTNLDTLKINYLTQAQFDAALANNEINENEIYITPNTTSITSTAVPTASTIAEFDSSAHMNSTDMSTQDVSDFVDGLNGQGANLADYVVEQGTSGIWTYRKWNSGIAECWGEANSGSNISNSSAGGWYAGSFAVNFPDGLFITNPNAFVNIHTWGTGYHFGSAYQVTSTGMRVQAIRNDNNSSIMYANIHVIGKWK